MLILQFNAFVSHCEGPSFTIDTACSSSLMAVDLALVSIRTGKCEAAIVTGVNVCLKPQTSISFVKLGMLASDGKCKAFDASGEENDERARERESEHKVVKTCLSEWI